MVRGPGTRGQPCVRRGQRPQGLAGQGFLWLSSRAILQGPCAQIESQRKTNRFPRPLECFRPPKWFCNLFVILA